MFAIALLALALQQDQTPRPLVKDDRGLLKINRDFYELSASTGGDFYFWAPGEFAASRLQVPVHHEDVLLAYGSIDTKRVFDIPVESGAKAMTLFAGIQRKDLAVLLRPDGTVSREGIQSFQHMTVATVKAPAPGMWHLELHGAGTYAVTAHVEPGPDGIELVDLRFVEPGGRPGHEGMFPIKRALRRGEKVTCSVELSGPAKDVRLVFVARDGTVLGSADVEENGTPCVVPGVPYRTGVTGVDADGRTFQRVMSPLQVP